MLDVCLLGTGGMTPLPHRYLASAILRHQGRLVLIDCGEGTQISLKVAGWGFKEIGAILLTHLHADHVAGLPGMLLTIGNSGRRDPLTIYGPEGISRVVDATLAIAPTLPFPVKRRELGERDQVQVGGLEVRSLPVDHRVPCLAYSLYVARAPRFLPEKAAALGLPVTLWSRLQDGQPVEWQGRTVQPEEVLGEERRGIKLCYVTDTRPTPDLPGFVEGSDLLICEGMYGSPEDLPKALANRHMLFSEAAQIAREGAVRELWLTHYSPSLSDPKEWLEQATAIFPNTRPGHDRMVGTLRFQPSSER